jgi:3-isopropylmalate dehydrogenase
VYAGGLWRRVVDQVAADFPEVTTDYLHVDAATIALVTDPGRFDVIVTDNLFGDILTDEAAAVTGGIGLAASANLNVEGRYPSMFEPVHGSAPDIAGQGIADPRAAILSAALLLEHLGHGAEAAGVRAAVEADIVSNGPTPRPTAAITSAIVDRVAI